MTVPASLFPSSPMRRKKDNSSSSSNSTHDSDEMIQSPLLLNTPRSATATTVLSDECPAMPHDFPADSQDDNDDDDACPVEGDLSLYPSLSLKRTPSCVSSSPLRRTKKESKKKERELEREMVKSPSSCCLLQTATGAPSMPGDCADVSFFPVVPLRRTPSSPSSSPLRRMKKKENKKKKHELELEMTKSPSSCCLLKTATAVPSECPSIPMPRSQTWSHSAPSTDDDDDDYSVEVPLSYLPSKDTKNNSSSSSSSRCVIPNKVKTVVSFIKTSLSMILISFSVVMISAAIITKQTVATGEKSVPPAVAFCVFWLSLLWLAIMEGGLNCMVGLQPIPHSAYQQTHPKTYLSTKICHRNENIERFIVGRQYLDLMIVFITSFMVSTIDDASVLGLPKIVNDIFLGSDVAVILCTIVFGQLIAQINCAHSMLDFINNWGMVFSTYVALCVEASGILHAVYFVQIIFTMIVESKQTSNMVVDDLEAANDNTGNTSSNMSKKDSTTTLNTSLDSCTTGRSSNSSEDDSDSASSDGCASINFDVSNNNSEDDDDDEQQPSRPWWQRVFFWARVAFSLAISVFAITVFSTAILTGNTTIRDSIPPVVSFFSLLILLILGGFMEALQIALFAVKHLPAEQIASNPRAKRNCEYILGTNTTNNNNNDNNDDADTDHEESSRLQAFLVGRQIAQTVIMFMIARIITVEMKVPNTTLFGVSPQIQTIFFDSGLLNALVSTIFASLSWRVTANFFPMLYLGSPFSIWIIRLCLIVEGTGICAAAWTLAKLPAYLVRYQKDTDYLSVVVNVDVDQQQQSQSPQQGIVEGVGSSFTNSESSSEKDDDVEQGTSTGGHKDNHNHNHTGKAPTNVTIVNGDDNECE